MITAAYLDDLPRARARVWSISGEQPRLICMRASQLHMRARNRKLTETSFGTSQIFFLPKTACSCPCGRLIKGRGDRDRQTERQIDRQTDRQAQKQRQRDRDTETEKDRERQRQRQPRERETDRQTDRQTQKQRQRDRDRETERDRDSRESKRRRDRQTEDDQTRNPLTHKCICQSTTPYVEIP